MFNPSKKVTSYTIQATRLKGFSLIELLVVIAIIGILAAGGGVYYSQARKQSQDLRRQSDLAAIQSALELYYSDEKTYPEGNLTELEAVLVPDYISKLPTDPKNEGESKYQYKYPAGAGDCAANYAIYTKAEITKNATGDPACPIGSGYIVLNGE